MAGAAPEVEFTPLDVQLRDGRRVTVRAVRAEDRAGFVAAFERLSAESRYTRFMSALRELPSRTLDRAVNPEQGRELQLIAVHGEGMQQAIVAGARYSAAADSKNCEFAVTVADDWRGAGLARRMLEVLMRAAHERGFERMEGYILASNAAMLGLAKRLGFERVESPEGPSVHLLRRDLTAA